MALNIGLLKKLGTLFKEVVGNVPFATTPATRNGAAIDRAVAGGVFYNGLTLVAMTGAVTGAPSGQTLDAKIQDSADGSTGWADYIPPGQATVAAIAQITAVNTIGSVDVDLSGARRYVRVVETTTLTAGTAPTIAVVETVILSGADRTPV